MTSDERASSRTVQGADTVVLAGSDDAEARLAAQVGSNIGRYVVLAEIGRGGMGRVLRAYDPKLQREVALKEVRSRLLGPIGARRLVAEARAMAKLAHPNVVAVYDVEELAHDHVVVVMEYVAGRTLTKWIAGRTWQEIVACFRRAGRGLAAAHAVGLLHRDFKPDNVLIADDGVVKVTDFGLAKLADDEVVALPQGGDEDGLTATGVVLGTPRFMAPEQHRGEQLGPAADQYAFCVALWYALVDTAPFDQHGLEALERAKSKGPPAWPGGPTPRAIVDAIARGLAPDPARRWPSIDALLDALAFDPAQRRRRWLRAAAAIAVVGAAAFGVQRWASTRAQRCTEADAVARLEGAWDDARRTAVKEAVLGVGAVYSEAVWARTERKLDDYADAWTRMHVDACAATTLRGEQSATVLDLRMACLHRAKVELTAATRVLAAADAKTVQKAHELLGSLRRLERCADIPALQADVEPPLPEEAEAVEAVRAELATARAIEHSGHFDDALAHVATARVAAEALTYRPLHAELELQDGIVRSRLGKYPEAERALRESLRIATLARQWGIMQDDAAVLVSVVGAYQQRFDEAAAYADLGLGLAGGDPIRESRVHNNLSIGLLPQGRLAEAEAEARRTLELREAVLDPDDPALATTRANLANVLTESGRFAEAEQELRDALELLERTLGSEHPTVALQVNNLALSLTAQGRHAEAEVEARRALALKQKVLGPEHPEVATSMDAIANILFAEGKIEESIAMHREGIALEVRVLGHDHLRSAQSRTNLAAVYESAGRWTELEAEVREALAIREKGLPPEHPELASSRISLATALLRRGAIAEARPLAEAAWDRRKRDDIAPRKRGVAAWVLARIWWESGAAEDRKRAIALAERAVVDLTAGGENPQEVNDWLATRR